MIYLRECYFYSYIDHPPGPRPWRYDDDVEEFYVVTEDKTAHKKAERTKELEETELADSWLFSLGSSVYMVRHIQRDKHASQLILATCFEQCMFTIW